MERRLGREGVRRDHDNRGLLNPIRALFKTVLPWSGCFRSLAQIFNYNGRTDNLDTQHRPVYMDGWVKIAPNRQDCF